MKYKVYVMHKKTEVVSGIFVNSTKEIDKRSYVILTIQETTSIN